MIGGAHVGYRYEIPQWNWFSSSGIVLGIEGSVDGTSLTNQGVGFSDVFFINAYSKNDIQGGIRGTLGIAWDRLYIYATGGAAFGGFTTDIWGEAQFQPACQTPASPSAAQQAFRPHALDGRSAVASNMLITNNWFVKAEYRYTDFGTINEALFSGQLNTLFPGASIVGNRKVTGNQVQVGFDYKFDLFAPPPVVAKY